MEENKRYRNLEIECCSKYELFEVINILDEIGMVWYSGDPIKNHDVPIPYNVYDGGNQEENVCLLTHSNDRITWHTKNQYEADYTKYEHMYAEEFINEYNGVITATTSDISIEDFLYD